MVNKSHGPRRGTRQKMKAKKKTGITRFLNEFEVGQNVILNIQPSDGKFPSIKFNGSRGRILEKKGRAYCIEIKDKNALKKIYVNPEHLKAVK